VAWTKALRAIGTIGEYGVDQNCRAGVIMPRVVGVDKMQRWDISRFQKKEYRGRQGPAAVKPLWQRRRRNRFGGRLCPPRPSTTLSLRREWIAAASVGGMAAITTNSRFPAASLNGCRRRQETLAAWKMAPVERPDKAINQRCSSYSHASLCGASDPIANRVPGQQFLSGGFLGASLAPA